MALTLILSLAACGGCSSEKKSESNSASAVETAQATEQSEQGDSVVGTWINDDESGEVFVFKDDGTGKYWVTAGVSEDITYQTADGVITITYSTGETAERKYSVEGDTFKLESPFGSYYTYTKSKDEPTEAEATEEADDETLTKETMAKLVGDWTYTGMEDYVKLTFNEDGTGSYEGIDVTGLTFTYELTMEHKEFNNGEPYVDKTLKMNYSTGESEEIVIRFLEEGQETMTFSTTEGGGYTGIVTYYGGWIRA